MFLNDRASYIENPKDHTFPSPPKKKSPIKQIDSVKLQDMKLNIEKSIELLNTMKAPFTSQKESNNTLHNSYQNIHI